MAHAMMTSDVIIYYYIHQANLEDIQRSIKILNEKRDDNPKLCRQERPKLIFVKRNAESGDSNPFENEQMLREFIEAHSDRFNMSFLSLPQPVYGTFQINQPYLQFGYCSKFYKEEMDSLRQKILDFSDKRRPQPNLRIVKCGEILQHLMQDKSMDFVSVVKKQKDHTDQKKKERQLSTCQSILAFLSLLFISMLTLLILDTYIRCG